MTRATPQLRDFAELLIAQEASERKSSETGGPADFQACERLRPHLATLMGNTGFRALLSRALALTDAEIPWLRAAQVKADGSLEGLNELAARVAPDEIANGQVILLAQLLGLLVSFIGADLTLRLAREVWPKLSVDGLDLSDGRPR